jgi:hypothetical protein
LRSWVIKEGNHGSQKWEPYSFNLKPNNMRKYLIFYYAERNDECVDLEHIVEANDMVSAINVFNNEIKMIKRITTITELPYGE